MEENYNALVAGAFGITGANLIRHLIASEKPKFHKIIGIARREHVPEDEASAPKSPDRVHYITGVDATNVESVKKAFQENAKLLGSVTHVFLCAWTKGESEEENAKLNEALAKNILEYGVDHNVVKHVVLQTGLKHYGIHLHPLKKVPAREDDPLDDVNVYGPNFYYNQEAVLFDLCTRHGWTWNVLRPGEIIGHTGKSYMNFGQSLIAFALVCRELNQPFFFPGKKESFDTVHSPTDVDLLSRFHLWVCENKRTHNQAFNVVNGDKPYSWREWWTMLGKLLGLEVDVEPRPMSLEHEMKTNPKYKNAWKKLAEEHGLIETDLDKMGTWWFLDVTLGYTWDVIASMDKARSFGWKEEMDLETMLRSLIKKLQKDKFIPPNTLKE